MNSPCSYGNYCCHGNRSEELVDTLPIVAGDGPTVNMELEMSSINQSEDDDHSGGQEETGGI